MEKNKCEESSNSSINSSDLISSNDLLEIDENDKSIFEKNEILIDKNNKQLLCIIKNDLLDDEYEKIILKENKYEINIIFNIENVKSIEN